MCSHNCNRHAETVDISISLITVLQKTRREYLPKLNVTFLYLLLRIVVISPICAQQLLLLRHVLSPNSGNKEACSIRLRLLPSATNVAPAGSSKGEISIAELQQGRGATGLARRPGCQAKQSTSPAHYQNLEEFIAPNKSLGLNSYYLLIKL